jgi:hypothetical protein
MTEEIVRLKIEVLKALQPAFETVKHHQSLTGRVKPALRAAVTGVLKSDWVVMHLEPVESTYGGTRTGRLTVYEGNGADAKLLYHDALYLTWYTRDGGVEIPWYVAVCGSIKEQIAWRERWLIQQKAENGLDGELSKLSGAIEECRRRASQIVTETTGKDPSYELRDKFPFLFKEPGKTY